jgi:hypothetical protein
VTGLTWLLLGAAGAVPLGALVWARWRYGNRQLEARADKRLADARARMEKRDDAALAALFTDLGNARAAKRIRGLVDEKRWLELAKEWGDLWPELLHDTLTLDRALELGAAIQVLAERHRD